MSVIRNSFVAGLVLCCANAWADTYPSRTITLVVPFSANGPTDTIAHSVGGAMSKHLKQAVVIENVGGAGGTVGAAQVAQADPDGYTMLIYHVGMATAPALYPTLPFDPLRDFEFIGEVTDVPMTLVARNDFPAHTFKDAVAYVKANRDKVKLAHAGSGSASHLCGLLLMAAIEVDLKTVAYKGTGPAMDDLLAGKVDLMCDQTTNTTTQIRAGKVKALGITTTRRIASLPGVATLQEGGLKDFQVAVWHALYVPKGTPPAAVKRLTEALQAALQDSGVKARFNDLGTDPVALEKATPQYVRQHLSTEIKRWEPIIKRSGQYTD
ncbi:MAG TPA: tripartite tricarboxylate transporter substrate-binding protein [Burkholderiaceae bacterium]|nr:tripartite tricarboxylate transporter substrate-binding protein [Burkholderiaceae bacterium]